MPDSRCPWGPLLPSTSSASLGIFGEHSDPSSSSSTSPASEHPPLRQCIDPKLSAALESFSKLCCIEKTSSPQVPKSALPDSTATAMDEGRIEYLRSMSAQERSAAAEKLSGNDAGLYKRSYSDVRQRRSLIGGGGRSMQNFPPPITMIGSGGKARVYFKSLREDGRVVLKEIRIPTQRLLQATRRDGRLTMRVLRPDDADADEAERNRDGPGEEDDDNS